MHGSISEDFFMLQSRRSFLIGAGSLLTAAFVSDARSFILRNSRALLPSPLQVVQELHAYPSVEMASPLDLAHNLSWVGGDEGAYLLTLGRWRLEPPSAPTWHEFLISEGFALHTETGANQAWSVHGIEPEDYERPVDQWYWYDRWMLEDGPCAKAFRLLESIDVGPDVKSDRGPLLEFHQGEHPGDMNCYVNATDQLSLSLLQARLIDLSMPIKIVAWR
jgi:hypothetical protein